MQVARPLVATTQLTAGTIYPSARAAPLEAGAVVTLRETDKRVPLIVPPITSGRLPTLAEFQRSRVSRGERQRETHTIMYSFAARSSSLRTESR